LRTKHGLCARRLGAAGRPGVNRLELQPDLEARDNLAHELRTPLQVLIGNLELLEEESASELGKKPRAMIGRMTVKVFELQQTLDNLLSFTLAKAGGESAPDENLTVESILADLGPVLESANRDKGLELRFDFKDAPAVIRAAAGP
jgi:signal transduction histidine kinase